MGRWLRLVVHLSFAARGGIGVPVVFDGDVWVPGCFVRQVVWKVDRDTARQVAVLDPVAVRGAGVGRSLDKAPS